MDTSRRSLFVAGIGAVLGAASGCATVSRLVDAARPPLDGTIRFDAAARAAAADDFGHIVHATPAAVLLPGSADDIVATIRWSARHGLKFAAQGRRHSVFGRAMAADGVVAEMARLRAVHGVEPDRIIVEAGATWRDVLAATLPLGLTPPVLTDYLDLSIGGTLIVGGVGANTARDGAQSDNLIALDVATGNGDQLACSASHNGELFDTVRAGLGQVAVITRAVLKLVPAPLRLRRFLLFYPSLSAMLTDARLLAGDDRFDAVQGAIVAAPTGGWAFRLDAVKAFDRGPPDDLLAGLSDDPARRQASTMTYREYVDRLSPLEATLRGNGQWFHPHPWLMTFVGDSVVEAVVGETLAGLTPVDLGPFGQVSLGAFPRSAVGSPLLRLPSDDLCYAFNLVRFPTANSSADADRLVRANRAAYERVRAAGGTLYPVSAFPMSRDDWRRHFGLAFAGLHDAKQKFDPGHVLTPGYDIF